MIVENRHSGLPRIAFYRFWSRIPACWQGWLPRMTAKTIVIILVLLLAIFLRFYRLTENPPSLNWDEVSHGYNAYSVLTTGRDEWGVQSPSIFRAFGDYKLPAYIYLTSASIKVFGLNDFAIRFPSAFAGVLSVLFSYLLVKRIFKNDWMAIFTALLFAVSPWHIFLSRPAFEANLANMLILGGFFFLIAGVNGKKWFVILSAIFFGFSLNTYNSARVFVPLSFVASFFIYRREIINWMKKNRAITLISVAIFLILLLPMIFSYFTGEGRARFRWVTIIDEGVIARINQNRAFSKLPGPFPRIFHNKATYFSLIFTENIFKNLSPNYLFVQGGSNYQYNVPGKGVLYWVDIPLMAVGIIWLLRNIKRKESLLLIGYWLLAIVPSAATRDNPHVLRTMLVLPVPFIVSAIGARHLLSVFAKFGKSRRLATGLVIIYFASLGILLSSFINQYFGSYRSQYSWSWQYGYRELASYINLNYDKYDKIFITKKYGEPHEFLALYLKWDPAEFQNNKKWDYHADWYWVDAFDKYVFFNDWEIENVKCRMSDVKCMLVSGPGNAPEGWVKLKSIYFLDGKTVFEVFER